MTSADSSQPNADVVELDRQRPRRDIGTTKNSGASSDSAVLDRLMDPEARRELTRQVSDRVEVAFELVSQHES